jgi:hypothetical protein
MSILKINQEKQPHSDSDYNEEKAHRLFNRITSQIKKRNSYYLPIEEEIIFYNGSWVACYYCTRCGSERHDNSECNSQYHIDGSKIQKEKYEKQIVCSCGLM